MDINKEMVAFRLRLMAMAMLLAKKKEDAEDLVQEAFVRALANLDHFDRETGVEGLRAWLTTIMRNAFLSSYRKSNRLVFTDDPAYAEALRPSQPNQHVTVELRETLDEMTMLPAAQSQAVLHRAVGTKYREAAAVLGCAEGTFKSRTDRGIKALKARMERSA